MPKQITFERIILRRREEGYSAAPPVKGAKRATTAAKKGAPHGRDEGGNGITFLDSDDAHGRRSGSDDEQWVSTRDAPTAKASKGAARSPRPSAAKTKAPAATAVSKVARARAKRLGQSTLDSSDEERSKPLAKEGSGLRRPATLIMSIDSDDDLVAARSKKTTSSLLPLRPKQRGAAVLLDDSDSDASSVIPVSRAAAKPSSAQSQETARSSNSSSTPLDKLSLRQKAILHEWADQFRRRWDKYWILIGNAYVFHHIRLLIDTTTVASLPSPLAEP